MTIARKNPDATFKVLITWTKSGDADAVSNQPVVVEAYVPEEELVLDFGGVWKAPYGDIGSVAESGFNKLGVVTGGIALQDPRLSMLAWSGMKTPSVSLNLEFNAEEDAVLDVLQPLADLARMTLPSRSGIMITAPGPSIGGQVVSTITDLIGFTKDGKTSSNYQIGERISLKIGKSFVWPLCVVENCTIALPMWKAGRDGRYVSGKAKVTIKPFQAPFRGDIAPFFRMSA
jgi:hypothetical protein